MRVGGKIIKENFSDNVRSLFHSGGEVANLVEKCSPFRAFVREYNYHEAETNVPGATSENALSVFCTRLAVILFTKEVTSRTAHTLQEELELK